MWKRRGSLNWLLLYFRLECFFARPVLLQDYFGTISGTISSTTNSTKIVLETYKKMAFLEEVSGTILGIIFGTILFLRCDHVL